MIFKIFSVFAVLAVSACAGPLDNSDFIPGPSGDMGSGSDSGEIVPDEIKFDQVKVISFNVRTATADKNTDNAWDKRKAAAPALITKENPTVFGVQEAIREQVDYINSQLPDYEWIGVGRDDGENKGEFMAIFYKKSVVELVDWDTFWLSETPGTPSKGWDANYYRTATWAVFNHKATGKQFLYINTHLDHEAQTAREESIKLICAKLAELKPSGQTPVVITADFNSETSDAIFDPLKALMNNSREYSSATDSYATFNGWGTSNGRKIDHIFISPEFKSLQYRTIRERYAGVAYVSDHYPISVLLEFKASEAAAVASYASAPQTRVSFEEQGSDLRVTWNKSGESFSVFAGTASQIPATFAQTGVHSEGKEASFAASGLELAEGTEYFALYPASTVKQAPTAVALELAHQSGVSYDTDADKTYMYATAVCNDAAQPLKFNFTHLTAAFRLDIALPSDVTATSAESVVLSASNGLVVSAKYSIAGARPGFSPAGNVRGEIVLDGPFTIAGRKLTVYCRMFHGLVENLQAKVLVDGQYYVADIFERVNVLAGNWYYTASAKEVGGTAVPTLKVMSYNIRTSNADEGGFSGLWNTQNWSYRKSSVSALLKAESPAVFGVQEALQEQVDYLEGQLSGYGCYGVGRKGDGGATDEIMAIFYKTSELSLGEHGTFWLSETPDVVGSIGWGAAYTRTAAWAVFTHIATGRDFLYVNTHLDHKVHEARLESIKLILSKLAEINPENYPVVLGGDFNAVQNSSIFNSLSGKMVNTRVSSPITDSEYTYNAYDAVDDAGNPKEKKTIDHIFISSGFKSMEYRTITKQYGSVKYASDHYPISSLLVFE